MRISNDTLIVILRYLFWGVMGIIAIWIIAAVVNLFGDNAWASRKKEETNVSGQEEGSDTEGEDYKG